MDNESIRVLFSWETRIMTQLEDDLSPPAPRRDGWTPARRTRFLECLAATRNVSRACAAAGLSRQAVYRLFRRDAAFARAWLIAWELGCEARARAYVAAREKKPSWTVSHAYHLSTSRPGR